jgi:hypothetical protein
MPKTKSEFDMTEVVTDPLIWNFTVQSHINMVFEVFSSGEYEKRRGLNEWLGIDMSSTLYVYVVCSELWGHICKILAVGENL